MNLLRQIFLELIYDSSSLKEIMPQSHCSLLHSRYCVTALITAAKETNHARDGFWKSDLN